MALLDLSGVTRTLVNLQKAYFQTSPVWDGSEPTIVPVPPNRLPDDSLGLYLYHLCEDAHFKNLPSSGQGETPVRHTTMALNLYYQMISKSTSGGDTATFQEQLMMGIAVKAFHDFPHIDDGTEIIVGGNPVQIMDQTIRGANNRLEIKLQHVTHAEAINYWTEANTPIQLAAYYQVYVVFLEPEEPHRRAGRVLVRDIHTFIGGAPRLDSSQNILSFMVPGESDAREIELRPAQVPVGNQFTLTGSGLAGDSTSLILKNILWDEPVEVDPAWAVTATNDSVTAVVQETASGEDVLPGIYSARVKVIKQRSLSDGTVRDFEDLANVCPFTITPRIGINDISTPDANDEVTVKGYIFKHPDLAPEAVQVYLGTDRLTEVTAGPLKALEFMVVDPVLPDSLATIQLRLTAGLASGTVIPLRIFINGAESPPNWIEIP